MKKLLLIFLPAACCISILQAQDVKIDLTKEAKYSADFTRDFVISFTGSKAGEKQRVIISLKDNVPSIVADKADLESFTVPVTGAADGTLTFKDAKSKKQVLKADKLVLKAGDKTYTITKAKPAAQIKSTEIKVDLKNLKPDYPADFNNDFTVSFIKATAGKKVAVAIAVKETDVTGELTGGADLTGLKFNFKIDKESGVLTVMNDQDEAIKIDAGSFKITLDEKTSFTITNARKDVETPKGVGTGAGEGGGGEKGKEKIPYWSYLKDNGLSFSLQSYKIDLDNSCCDDCKSCDDDAFNGNNRIIYDARSGLTYFIPENDDVDYKLCGDGVVQYKKYKVTRKNPIKLSAGDPLVYIIQNVNPALYDIKLSDSSFLTNNNSTGLLESLLLKKSEDPFSASDKPGAQGGKKKKVNQEKDEQEYLAVKTGLLLVRSEMADLLAHYRRSSPYLHNCIQYMKRQALKAIDSYPSGLRNGSYSGFSFLQLVDIFLNQETEDSVLNHQIHVLYDEFIAASYTIAYRQAQVPAMDQLNFHLSITPKANSPYHGMLNPKSDQPTQTVRIKNFFKIDVSSGLYLGFMKDQTWALQPDTVSIRNVANTADSLTNIKRLVREDAGTQELGFASFLHLYYKYSTWCNVGAIIGAGISFDKTIRPRYFTGLSLMLGTNNRLCLNGGVVWGNYEDISNRYIKKGDSYNTLKDTESSINYATSFKHAGFVSISYNIPFIKRTAEAGAKPNSSTPAPPVKEEGKDTEKDKEKEKDKDK